MFIKIGNWNKWICDISSKLKEENNWEYLVDGKYNGWNNNNNNDSKKKKKKKNI